MSGLAVIFAGGGSGGHLFPGIAIAERLEADTRSLFVCSDRAIDREILDREAREPRVSPAAPLGMRPKALWKFVSHWGRAVRFGRGVIRELKDSGRRVVVVAVGGFVAAPTVQAARAERVPVVMLNLDAVPGKANRWISRHAARVLTTADVGPASWERIAPLVRTKGLAPADPRECRALLGLEPDRPTLFVTGASQGAGTINRLMEMFVDARHAALVDGGWQVLHQAGAGAGLDDLASAYARAGVPAKPVAFVEEMGLAWGAADLAVARAAAGTVGEITVNRVPAVFLPYPFHRDMHQRHNARPLVERGCSAMVDDLIDPARTMEDFSGVLTRLLSNSDTREGMRNSLSELAQGRDPSAGPLRVVSIVNDIAKEVMEVAR